MSAPLSLFVITVSKYVPFYWLADTFPLSKFVLKLTRVIDSHVSEQTSAHITKKGSAHPVWGGPNRSLTHTNRSLGSWHRRWKLKIGLQMRAPLPPLPPPSHFHTSPPHWNPRTTQLTTRLHVTKMPRWQIILFCNDPPSWIWIDASCSHYPSKFCERNARDRDLVKNFRKVSVVKDRTYWPLQVFVGKQNIIPNPPSSSARQIFYFWSPFSTTSLSSRRIKHLCLSSEQNLRFSICCQPTKT